MSEEQEREAARLLALVLADSRSPDHRRRSAGAFPVRLEGRLPRTTRRPGKRRDRRCGGRSGSLVNPDIPQS